MSSDKVDLANPRELRLMALNLAVAARANRTGVDFRTAAPGVSDDHAAQILHDADAFARFLRGGAITTPRLTDAPPTPPE